jgi:ribosomal protein L37AE/L43A
MHDVKQHIEIIEEKMCPIATCSKCGANIDLSRLNKDGVYRCDYCGVIGKAPPWISSSNA